MYILNEFAFSFDIKRITQYQCACLEQPRLTSVRLKPPIMCLALEVHVKVASLGCYDAAEPQWRTSFWGWNDAAQPGHFCGQ